MKIDDIIRIQFFKKKQNYSFNGHSHENIELNIIIEGSLVVSGENRVFELHKNDILFTNSYIYHSAVYPYSDVTKVINIQFMSNDFREKYPDPHSFFTLDDTGILLFQAFIADLPKLNTKYSNSIYGSQISESAVKILETLLFRLSPKDLKPNILTLKSATIYNDAVNYIVDNMKNNPTLDDISAHVGCSKTTLRNIFTQYTGKSTIEYFNQLQMSKALEKILKGEKATDVAKEFGFVSQSYFSQKFKRVMKFSIQHYQKELKNKNPKKNSST